MTPVAGRGVGRDAWPPLPLAEWQDTYATLHMWTQVVGKIRLALWPLVNHWWNVTLYATPRGLTTGAMPHGSESLQIDFDFVDHRLEIATSRGDTFSTPLAPRSVADFYRAVMGGLDDLGMPVRIWTQPQEVDGAIPFDADETHAAYDPDAAHRLWRILIQCDRVMGEFRSRFLGKASPVHFFWGAFDMAVTRFSGRTAPLHPGAPFMAAWVAQEAYSHECSSCGFWPGGGPVPEPVFYSYTYPEPAGFRDWPVAPAAAFYSTDLFEYLLPYEAVRNAADPDATLLSFFETTYEAGAVPGAWDRAALERPGG
ncbi:MAG TPA: DUF5996 family protein [Gemmatimonadota bacterium]|nr:DUF5996 family protein [Gemmatimonadota bacterium]